jgi:DNA-binding MarR family transcriptional regulator
LSRHLGVLEQAGYVEIHKAFEDRKPRTWVHATRSGRAALAAEVAALRELLADHV